MSSFAKKRATTRTEVLDQLMTHNTLHKTSCQGEKHSDWTQVHTLPPDWARGPPSAAEVIHCDLETQVCDAHASTLGLGRSS